uniref:Uncharacterized protein n=1 Tax=Cacopsylla melanoneura TaxID=428564 RepID=A0A8D8M451_9HEMI
MRFYEIPDEILSGQIRRSGRLTHLVRSLSNPDPRLLRRASRQNPHLQTRTVLGVGSDVEFERCRCECHVVARSDIRQGHVYDVFQGGGKGEECHVCGGAFEHEE